jgi:K+ transporter
MSAPTCITPNILKLRIAKQITIQIQSHKEKSQIYKKSLNNLRLSFAANIVRNFKLSTEAQLNFQILIIVIKTLSECASKRTQ